MAFAPDSFNLQPANNLVQGLLSGDAGSSATAGIMDYSSLPPAPSDWGEPTVRLGTNDTVPLPTLQQSAANSPQTVSTESADTSGPVVPVSDWNTTNKWVNDQFPTSAQAASPATVDATPTTGATSPAASGAPVNPLSATAQQLQKAYQDYANYKTPMQAHPILGALGSFYFPQVGMIMNAVGNAGATAKQREIQNLQALYQMQQAALTNQNRAGEFNSVAPNAGLAPAVPGATIDDKDLTLAQTLAQKYGAPKLIQAQQQYNMDAANYERAQQALATYQQKANAGILTDAEKQAGPPAVPPKPEFKIDGINPYLDAGTAAGVTGTSGEAMKTGEESGEKAAANATTLKDAQARIEEAKAKLAQDAQIAQDRLQEMHDWHQTLAPIMQQKADQTGALDTAKVSHMQNQDSLAKTRAQSGAGQLLYRDAELASHAADKASQRMQDLNKLIIQRMNKDGANFINDPGYTSLVGQYNNAKAQFAQAQSITEAKRQKFDAFVNGSQPVAAPQISATPATGHTITSTTQAIKVPKLFTKYLKGAK